ncbi:MULTISPECIES: hypothetical protein [unclassified Burkholderia]|uniref:hypothetical protein n=1 Tax=unclassified Burkholderia TaxID=2613784 RepID=UPI000F58207B|nr:MULTISPECIES: hypothetical protein [unclassified Burkholderia]RQR87683.1 hypothetical protein DIE10_06245 [Burkholderia sp. Bp9011]RQR97030.1 hypothetical protein DIE09_06430 [Burkholderia sp. Bp9010]
MIPKNCDLRHYNTGLTDSERREAIYECQRLKQIDTLGARHLTHKANAPAKGRYNPITGVALKVVV